MINVLDHGYIRLVSYMQPAYPDSFDADDKHFESLSWTGDKEIVRNARVSYDNDGAERTDAQDQKLISYLYSNSHTSPFEAMVFTFEVKCPIFIARQWQRHRTWKYNEVSARYTELPEEFYVPEALYEQGKGNKQMSGTDRVKEDTYLLGVMISNNERAFNAYHHLLSHGASREIARTVLPLATYTRFFCTVDLHNLFHFLRLRLHPHAQMEIRVYAEAILN